MRIEREVNREEHGKNDRGEPVLGPPINCTRVCFEKTELGAQQLLVSQSKHAFRVYVTIMDTQKSVKVLSGEVIEIIHNEKDGSIALEISNPTLIS
jgi:hypothetical protein